MSRDSSRWTPPAGYVQVESALPGITVFAPRPETTNAADAPATYKCPNCGAATRYDVAAGGVACEHCGYVAQARGAQVGRQAGEFEFTLETLSQVERGWGAARREMHCDTCGADLALAEGSITATCPFCASNKVNVHAAEGDQLRPRFLVPFAVAAQAAQGRLRDWLGQGWYHPPDLAKAAGIERLTGVYLPFWTFDAAITGHWRAEVGYERTESYYDHSDNAWKTRTVIDWRWESDAVPVQMDDLVVAGTSRVSRVLLDRLGAFDLSALVAYAPDYLAGWQAQAYDVALMAAWEQGKTVMREEAKRACRASIASGHVRNFSLTADFADETWRYVLLPVYLAAYRFEDKVFQVLVHGQGGEVVGQKPILWWKVWLVIAALLSPGILFGLIGLPLMFLGGIGLVPIVIGFALLIGGGVAGVRLYQQAVASEAA